LKILETQVQIKKFREEYKALHATLKSSSREKWSELEIQVIELRINIKEAKSEFNYAIKKWRLYAQFAAA
jgi:hypothetical protein